MKKNNSLVTMILVASFGLSLILNAAGNVDEKAGSAKIKVKQKIQLTNNTDLLFPDAYQGDSGETVAPSAANASQFTVTGQKSAGFVVSFPSASINMITGDGSTADKIIAVSNFQTDLASNVGTLGATSGSLIFHVGADRAAISNTQEVADDYTGEFLVRVTYQ